MRRIALALLCASLLLAGVSHAHDPYEHAASYALKYACRVQKLDCSGLEPPVIMFGHIRKLNGWLGYYWHDETPGFVILDLEYEPAIADMDLGGDPMAWSILVHEITHYADRALTTTVDPCKIEENGWRTGNLWLIEHGHSELAAWNWRLRYNGC